MIILCRGPSSRRAHKCNDDFLKTLVGVGLAIFVLTWFIWFFVGGDASGGRVTRGQYYVNRKGHLIEVSHNAFNYSLWLGYTNDVSFPVAFFSGAYLAEKKRSTERVRLTDFIRRHTTPE